MKHVVIDGKTIGPGYKPYVVAEISGNHNGEINRALELVELAAQSGADAVKLQTYRPDTMTIESDRDDFKVKGGLWDGYTLYDLYQWAHTPWEWHEPLFEKAKEVGITIFSSPFDETAVDYLEELDVPAYKIASFEVVDLPLIEKVAKTGKPVVISTGMANIQEIGDAVNVLKKQGCEQIIVLHCISSYPAPIEQANILTIPEISKRFDVVSGLSDHTLSNTAAVASVALGAHFIEKHIIQKRSDGGPDSAFSLEPHELKSLCDETSAAYQSLGHAGFDLKDAEKASTVFRRSLYVVEDVKAGEAFTDKNVRRIRPGYGMPPRHFSNVLTKVAAKDILRGTALTADLIEGWECT